ncbi:MAG: hypothetical protein EOP45_09075 [Sphingobacteriaceae bacterium]|nr:MAG: hypothetical protein EOP45_09075 [Sphingobacteriaceae bacterium]
MRKPREDEIPVSTIRHDTVYADFNELNGEGKILYLNPKCVLIGLNEVPHMLFVTPDFNQDDLKKNIGENLYEIKQLVLQSNFLNKSTEKGKYYRIPDWLLNFKKIEYLKVESAELDDLWLLRNLPVQHLILKHIKFNDATVFTNSVTQFHFLKEITYDDSLNEELIGKVTLVKPNLKFSYEAE